MLFSGSWSPKYRIHLREWASDIGFLPDLFDLPDIFDLQDRLYLKGFVATLVFMFLFCWPAEYFSIPKALENRGKVSV